MINTFKNILFIVVFLSINLTFSQEYMAKELKPIRENFKRINAIKNWSSIKKVEKMDSSEGGEVTYYYNGKTLEKIIAKNFGETGKAIIEFYLQNNNLSFVFEKLIEYNNHISNENFNMDSAKTIEERSYFKNEKLIRQINNQDCGSPFALDYLEEEYKRLTKEYNKILLKIE